MLMMLQKFCGVLTLILAVLYAYQAFYVVVGLLRRKYPVSGQAKTLHRYAVLISARNEEEVIGELIESLQQQDYPKELLDIYVIADNCTDATAQVARQAGAHVYERFDRVRVGKGYAMDWFFHRLEEEGKGGVYDGYFVFDADNIVDPAFVREMNNVFDSGDYAAITCYRNSKNYASNWISAGYSLWFLREARFLNFSRMQMGTGCAISGTGFLVSAQVVRDNGGWPYHLLTEDIQFSIDCAVQGRRIGYCDKAVVYDEQPTTFQQSCGCPLHRRPVPGLLYPEEGPLRLLRHDDDRGPRYAADHGCAGHQHLHLPVRPHRAPHCGHRAGAGLPALCHG